MAHADYGRRVAETRERMKAANVDGLLITNPYNRRYLTGLAAIDHNVTESAGLALVTHTGCYLITGTYHLQGVEDDHKLSGARIVVTDTGAPADFVAQVAERDGVKRLGFEGDWTSYTTYERVGKALGGKADLLPTLPLVEMVRASKDAAEIATIRRAADIANRAFAELVKQLRLGMTERQIAALLDRLMVDLGAEEPSFETLVACGPSAAQIHAYPSDREVRAGEPLLIDFGCRVDGYCSDLTRTVVLGEPSDKLVELYGIVRAAQDAAYQALQDGVRKGTQVDAAGRAVIEKAGHGKDLLHGLGHGIGLAVHELPSITMPRPNNPELQERIARTEQIPTSAVVTNEPGIYLEGWGGVRLEDDILVTEGGAQVLTERSPQQILRIPTEGSKD